MCRRRDCDVDSSVEVENEWTRCVGERMRGKKIGLQVEEWGTKR